MLYQKPWMEVLKFNIADVICSSVTVNGNHDIVNPPNYSDEEGQDW